MYLIFDIGGTQIKLAISSDGQNLDKTKTIPTQQDFYRAITAIKEAAFELSGGEPFQAAAGGARALDQTKTKLVNRSHFPLWVDAPLKGKLEEVLNTRVKLENDAAVAGLGETLFGAGKDYRIVVYITVSTGIGGARIVEGKIDQNTLGFEPGNQIITLEGDTLESLISGVSLERKYGQKPQEINDPGIWDSVARILAIGLNNSVVHWSPDIIILGGSVSESIPLDKVNGYLRQFLTVFPEPPKITKSALGSQAGLLGALKLLT
ncbi:MAG: ROK family protein [Candidatus Levybacteria bacterium]|nr:ROK family protein [Candidatus Levybacteria bacterium]